MSYSERLRRYEQEKRRLQSMNLTYREYEKALRELARKWRV